MHRKVTMLDLDKALSDIRTMRRQMARNTEFRGYGHATLSVTSVLAVMAAGAQTVLLPDPSGHINGYLGIWVSTAVLCASLTGAQTYMRSRRIHSGMSDEMLHMAIEQFLPSVGASTLVTFVLLHYLPNALWMCPAFGSSSSVSASSPRAAFFRAGCPPPEHGISSAH